MKQFLPPGGLAVASFAAAYLAVVCWPRPAPPGMCWIPGGEFTMGSNDDGKTAEMAR